jgi:2'-5' RNA ligase
LSKSLFFLALVPDNPVQHEIMDLKNEAARRFQSKHALKSPAHITIIPPFFWEDQDVPELRATLLPQVFKQSPLLVEIDGFDRFDKRVIFVKPKVTRAMKELHRNVESACKEELAIPLKSGHSFNPHLTIAFKDLKRSIFPLAWEYFQNLTYRRSFWARGLSLLRHNGQLWEERETFRFRGLSQNSF